MRGNQTLAEKKRNEELAKLFKIRAFPTLLLLDASGRPYAEAEMLMGVSEHLAQLLKLTNVRTGRDASFAEADQQSGVDKAKSIERALAKMGLSQEYLTTFYNEAIAEIEKNAPDFRSGVEATNERRRFFKRAKRRQKNR